MYDIIINPLAGKTRAKKNLAIIEEKLKTLHIEYKIHYSDFARHAIALTTKAIDEGATDIIAIGGDGTFNEVLNGFKNFENVNLGLIPSGTGNDFASACGIPLKPLDALDIILNQEPKFTDYMQMGEVRGLNSIGMGIDVDVLKRAGRCKILKGKIQYLYALIVCLLKFKPYHFTAKFNDKVLERSALIVEVGNGLRIGGGIRVCPKAIIDDGKLDVVICNNVSKKKMVPSLIKLMNGTILETPFTEFDRTNEVEILPQGEYSINVDGEIYENIPFKINIVSETLKIFRK